MGIIAKQSGVFTFAPPNTVVNQAITAVADMAKTIVVCQVKGIGDSSSNMSYFGIGCLLTSTTNIQFNRHFGNITNVQVHWQVIETDDYSVQRGTLNLTSSIINHTVSLIDESKTVSTTYCYGGAFPTLMHDGLVRSIVNSTTNLKMVTSFPNASNYANWQVVEIPGASVQKAESSVGPSTFNDFTITSVDTTQSVLIHDSFSYSTSTLNPSQMRGGRLLDATTVRMSAYASGSLWIQFYILEHSDFTVQRGWDVLSGASFLDKTITSVDTSKTFGNLGGQYGSWQTTNTTGVNFQDFAFTNTFNSATSIRLAKDSSTYDSTISWEVVEVTGGASPAPKYDYYNRMNQC